MSLVIKFGGEAIRDGDRIRNAAEFVVKKHSEEEEIVVVTSAIANQTDQLIEIAQKLIDPSSNSEEKISEFLDQVSKKHLEVCRKAINDGDILDRTIGEVKNELKDLRQAMLEVAGEDELSPKSLDLMMSFGERLLAPILAGAIRDSGTLSESVTGYEAGIVTDDQHLEAQPLQDKMREGIKRSLKSFFESDEIPVITGFVAGTEEGVITTLGRGGSDYTASIVGSALDVDEIWIMTDVDGIMTADPKIEQGARIIHEMSYLEATELSYFGAQVLNPKTIEPAMNSDIPVRVKNAFSPESSGTLIIHDSEERERIVKAITASRKVAIITVGGPGMVGTPGVAAEVLRIMEKACINVLMISQSSSQANISFVVKREDLKQTLHVLKSSFVERGVDWDIDYDEDVSVVATVGAGMRGTPGVAAHVFETMGRNDVNIFMISQGSSELNISFAIDEKNVTRAVRALHEEFGLDGG